MFLLHTQLVKAEVEWELSYATNSAVRTERPVLSAAGNAVHTWPSALSRAGGSHLLGLSSDQALSHWPVGPLRLCSSACSSVGWGFRTCPVPALHLAAAAAFSCDVRAGALPPNPVLSSSLWLSCSQEHLSSTCYSSLSQSSSQRINPHEITIKIWIHWIFT